VITIALPVGTAVAPGGDRLEAPMREILGDDPAFDDPTAPGGGVDAARVFIWDLYPGTHQHREYTLYILAILLFGWSDRVLDCQTPEMTASCVW